MIREHPELATIHCPCCETLCVAEDFAKAPSATRGPIVLALSRAGLTPKQIAEVLGWPRSTVRSLLWYQRHAAKVKP